MQIFHHLVISLAYPIVWPTLPFAEHIISFKVFVDLKAGVPSLLSLVGLISFHSTKDNEYFIKNYNELILSKLKPELVYNDLYNLAGETSNFAMICYETPSKFCHRHLVSRWLSDHGIPCQEWKSQEEF